VTSSETRFKAAKSRSRGKREEGRGKREEGRGKKRQEESVEVKAVKAVQAVQAVQASKTVVAAKNRVEVASKALGSERVRMSWERGWLTSG
jgi:hypothetical protein